VNRNPAAPPTGQSGVFSRQRSWTIATGVAAGLNALLVRAPGTLKENHIMTSGFPYFLSAETQEMEFLRGKSIWALVLGCALILAGVLAISYPAITTLYTVTFFGVLLLIAGVLQMLSAFWARRWGGFFLYLLIGLLYLFIGVVLVEQPLISAVEYTLLLAVFFVAAGLVRVVAALSLRFSGWGWSVLNGAITLLLGVLIWRKWPGDGLLVIGTLVGIEFLFSGWSLVMLGLAMRSIPRAAPPA
jgi:uncharacterized membrane protein HdeD (DUF308 family)